MKKQQVLGKLQQSRRSFHDWLAILWFCGVFWPLFGLMVIGGYTAKVYMKLMDRVIDIKIVNKLLHTEAHLLTENGVVVFKQSRFKALLNKVRDWKSNKKVI